MPSKNRGKNQQLEIGLFDYQSDEPVFLCRWNDKSLVIAFSNHCTHLPRQLTNRYLHNDKKKAGIPQQNLIHKYTWSSKLKDNDRNKT